MTTIDEHPLLTAGSIQRELARLLNRRRGVSCSLVIVRSPHHAIGSTAQIFLRVDERKVKLIVMLERLRLPLEEFSALVLVPLLGALSATTEGNHHGKDEEKHREEAVAS